MTSDTMPDPHAIGATVLSNVQKDTLKVYLRKALPGVVILVHGVNSMGEWFDDAEAGLCKGLNTRLRRDDKYVEFPKEVGQMSKAAYMTELLKDGFIDPELDAENFVAPDNYSPVIRFRWGYKADLDEIGAWGGNIWLDEFDSWGGGPFANGCASLPDCFNNGVVADLFLLFEAQDINPTDRDVYSCPSRHYMAHAAWRLAKLVELVRKTHRDLPDGDHTECPVTVVCHSQGNMIGLISAFVGQKELKGEGVADTYILCNPPYSLDEEQWTDNLVEDNLVSTQDDEITHGRVTRQARLTTLNRVFEFVKQRDGKTAQSAADIDKMTGNLSPKADDGAKPVSPASVAEDQKEKRINTARVFLYSNPHDQLIGSSPVRGIGWRGVGDDELGKMLAAPGVLYQRVFAQGFEVGGDPGKVYDAWNDRWNKYDKDGKLNKEYWHPAPPQLRIRLKNIVENSRKNILKKLGSMLVGVVLLPIELIMSATTNALSVGAYPPKNWKVKINAPKVPNPIKPRNKHGKVGPDGNVDEASQEKTFDLGKESASQEINSKDEAPVKKGDAYDRYRQSKPAQTDEQKPVGDKDREAQLRYEHNARARMSARRSNDEDISGQADKLKQGEALPTKFGDWLEETRFKFLTQGVNQNSVDHGTIVGNAYHAEHIMAYDLPIGYCSFSASDWAELRKVANWRWCIAAENKKIADYGLYFKDGKFNRVYPHKHPDYQPEKAAALGMADTRAKKGPAKSGLNSPRALSKAPHEVTR
jgi:hypothetical protein